MQLLLIVHAPLPLLSHSRRDSQKLERLMQVMPVLVGVLLHSKEDHRKELVENLAKLVGLLRQHLRKWLGDLMHLVNLFWTSKPELQRWLLKLIKELAGKFTCKEAYTKHSSTMAFILSTSLACLCLTRSKPRKKSVQDEQSLNRSPFIQCFLSELLYLNWILLQEQRLESLVCYLQCQCVRTCGLTCQSSC